MPTHSLAEVPLAIDTSSVENSRDQTHHGPLPDDKAAVEAKALIIVDLSNDSDDSEDEETRQMDLQAKALEKEVRKMDKEHKRKLAKRRLDNAQLAFEARKKRKGEEGLT